MKTMGHPTKVQCIKRAASEQWYINFPAPIAQAMGFVKGETVEWTVADKGHLILARAEVPADPIPVPASAAKKKSPRSSGPSTKS